MGNVLSSFLGSDWGSSADLARRSRVFGRVGEHHPQAVVPSELGLGAAFVANLVGDVFEELAGVLDGLRIYGAPSVGRERISAPERFPATRSS